MEVWNKKACAGNLKWFCMGTVVINKAKEQRRIQVLEGLAGLPFLLKVLESH